MNISPLSIDTLKSKNKKKPSSKRDDLSDNSSDGNNVHLLKIKIADREQKMRQQWKNFS